MEQRRWHLTKRQRDELKALEWSDEVIGEFDQLFEIEKNEEEKRQFAIARTQRQLDDARRIRKEIEACSGPASSTELERQDRRIEALATRLTGQRTGVSPVVEQRKRTRPSVFDQCETLNRALTDLTESLVGRRHDRAFRRHLQQLGITTEWTEVLAEAKRRCDMAIKLKIVKKGMHRGDLWKPNEVFATRVGDILRKEGLPIAASKGASPSVFVSTLAILLDSPDEAETDSGSARSLSTAFELACRVVRFFDVATYFPPADPVNITEAIQKGRFQTKTNFKTKNFCP